MATSTSINEHKLEQLSAPAETKHELREFLNQLHADAGNNLQSVILYGGLAAGRFDALRSDINVVVVLHDVGALSIKGIGETLRKYTRDLRIEPMIMTEQEITASADTFPIKFLHIKHKHVTLFGEPVFETLEVGRKHVRLRAEQELRNLAMRMRRALVTFETDPYRLVDTMTRSAPTLELALGALLMLEGTSGTEDMNYQKIVDLAAKQFGLDHDALVNVVAYRKQKFDVDNVPQIFDRLLATVSKAASLADSLE